MKCIIPGNNVRVFGKAIHCLSKIGEDLYIEPLENGLALRTVNTSRSAYACFMFAPTFFYHYDDGKCQNDTQQQEKENEDDGKFKCKITMKSCLSVFKSLPTIEKTVEKCKIKLNFTDARLVFTLLCKHGITKTYNLTFQETESLQAVFAKDLCPNKIVAQSKLLCDAVGNFQTSQEEVTLIVSPEKVCLKNYVDDEPDPNKVMHTEMSLLPEEFDDYTIGLDTEVTFCLKELRAILTFADACYQHVSIFFETIGKPIVFALDGESVFEASFVLATLAEPGSTQNTTQVQPAPTARRTVSKTESQKKTTVASKKTPAHESRSCDGWNDRHNGFNNTSNQPDRPSAFSERNSPRQNLKMAGDAGPSRMPDIVARIPDGREDDDCSNASSESFTFQGKIGIQTSGNKPECFNVQIGEGDTSTVDIHIPSGDEDEFDFIPSTPPTKKFKSMFFGSSQSQTNSSQNETMVKPTTVLAEDTDEDDSD
ncbi:cell cycle checkpoint control protein RAD9A-like [Saccoglossus kowalevskii]|uniref:Cell cycle checkpoint control protein n=1 Tax=Saccoglossus kowalevskii TaxID=10224 RepID=A0ABM0MW74_SACKO|nr:PREDICTED: cell cycle checkpoint control protein RAD9B-like [Saccoglossus kowalevskii]